MPRFVIPQVLATTGTAVVDQPKARPVPGAAGTASAVGEAAGVLAQVGGELARREDEAAKVRSRVEAADLLGSMETAIHAYRAQPSLADETDPDAYIRSHDEGLATIRGRTLERAKEPYTAQILAQKLPSVLSRYQDQAIARAGELRQDQAKARVQRIMETHEQLASTTDDPTEFARLYTEGSRAIMDSAAALGGVDKAEALRKGFKERLFHDHAIRDAGADPEGFISRVDRGFYSGMKPETRDQMRNAAATRVEVLTRERNAEWDRWYKDLEQQAERERQGQLVVLSDQAAAGELTASRVRQAADMGIIVGRTEFEHYMTLATAPPKDTPSDVALWGSIQSDVWSSNPVTTERRVQQLMAAHRQGLPGLNGTDGKMALSELARKAQHQQDQAYSRHQDAYQKAVEEGREALGVTTPMAQLDGPTAAIVAAFRREFNARMLDPQGNVRTDLSPRQVLYEVLPRFIDQQSTEAKLNYTQRVGVVSRNLGAPAPDALDAGWLGWYSQQQQKVEALRQTDPNLYKLRREELEGLLKGRGELIRTEASRQQQNARQKGSGIYTPPPSAAPAKPAAKGK